MTLRPVPVSIGRAATGLVLDFGVCVEVGTAVHDLDVLKPYRYRPFAIVIHKDRSANAPDVCGHARATSGGNSLLRAMSLMASLPPGLRTLAISLKTAGLSGARLMTQLLMMQSTEASGSGFLSIVERIHSTF
jgi:hypothetical protein